LFSWLRRRRGEAHRAEVEAALLARFRPGADPEAGRRRQDADDADVFAHWDRVVRVVAQLTGRPIGPGAPATAEQADFSKAERADFSKAEPDALEKLEHILQRRKQ
jgi:hypothetical protein